MSEDKPPFKLPRRMSMSLWFGIPAVPLLAWLSWRIWGTDDWVPLVLVGLYVVWLWPGTFRPTVLTVDGFRVGWRAREIPFFQITHLKTRLINNACTATLRDGTTVMLALGRIQGYRRKQMLQWVNTQIASNAFE